MNHLVIDVEMCMVQKCCRSKAYPYAYEIIQVGAVLLDESYEVIGRLNQYVKPEYGEVDLFISGLTGIQSSQLKNAPGLEEALQHMLDWLGDREYKIYAWSDSDFKQLRREISAKGICDAAVARFMEPSGWIDYQAVFGKRFQFSRAVSLEDALMGCDIAAEGRFHDGLDDAVNTAALIKKLETEPEIVLRECMHGYKTESEPLSYSMGSLFAGLKLNGIA